jgi:CelD/BcsL family acetyltransferase involved in cellulose biosynthesis
LTAIAESRVVVTSLPAVLSLGESTWEAVRGVGAGSPFSSWAWHDAWQAFAPREERDAAFTITATGSDGKLTAILPLARTSVTHRRLSAMALTWSIGDLGCPDHLDVMMTDGAPAGDIVDALEDTEWDMIRLDNIASDAVGAPKLLAALRARGIEADLRPQFACPYLDLPATWEEFYKSMCPNHRRAVQRHDKASVGRESVAVTFYTSDRIEEGMNHLRRLHDARWNGNGGIDDRLAKMQQRFATALGGTHAWLTTIDVGGRPISAWYGFSDTKTLYYYQAGRDPSRNDGIGTVHLALVMRRAIAHGLTRFDFLRGDEAYKSRWTTSRRWTQQLVAFRRSARGHMLRLADRAALWRERLQQEPS